MSFLFFSFSFLPNQKSGSQPSSIRDKAFHVLPHRVRASTSDRLASSPAIPPFLLNSQPPAQPHKPHRAPSSPPLSASPRRDSKCRPEIALEVRWRSFRHPREVMPKESSNLSPWLPQLRASDTQSL